MGKHRPVGVTRTRACYIQRDTVSGVRTGGVLSAEEWEIIRLSLRVGAVSTVAALPVAFALAFTLARRDFPGRTLLDALVHLPLVLPPVVTGWALLLLFGRRGPIGHALEACCGMVFAFRWTGAALAAAVMALPLMVRAMRLSIEAVDTRLENAVRTLGASPWRAFLTVTLPLSMPGILAAVALGFARSLGEFGATVSFVSSIPGETRTLPLAIYGAMQLPAGETQVLRLALVSIALALAMLLLSELLLRRQPGRQHEL